MKYLYLIITTVFFTSTGFGQTFNFDFSTSTEGWIGGFSDLPRNQEIFYELDFQWSALPTPLNTAQNSLYISGNNHSDDLFMFIKKKITGLQPNTTYTIAFNIEFASIYPTNGVGVGGAPGEGVTMKAGATLIEPDTIDGTMAPGNPELIMNIDKANQIQPGLDMDTIGHVGVADTTTVYALKSNNNLSHLFSITTDSTGEVWLIIGTDSGFEATTSLYYNKIDVTFSTVTSIQETDLNKHNSVLIFPNPTTGNFKVNSEYDISKIEVYSMTGQLIETITLANENISLNLSNGTYILKSYTTTSKVFNQKILISK